MNIAFWILIWILAFLIWTILIPKFKDIGAWFVSLYDDLADTMSDDEENNN